LQGEIKMFTIPRSLVLLLVVLGSSLLASRASPRNEEKKPPEPESPSLAEVARRLAALAEKKPAGMPPAAPKFPFDATATRQYQRAYGEWLGLPVEWKHDLGLTFVLVPPGTFRMGSPDDEPGHNASGYEETIHTVTLTRPFYLSKFETTTGQFRRF